MKTIIKILILFLLSSQIIAQNQEKKISFKKGTIKICSSKNFQIKGYDGKEIIIKRIDNPKNDKRITRLFKRNQLISKRLKMQSKMRSKKNQILYNKNNVFFYADDERAKGLKKLGKNSNNDWLLLNIKKTDNELLITDLDITDSFMMISGESYQILVPNSLKLVWNTTNCKQADIEMVTSNTFIIYNSKESFIENFNGEVEISTSLNNLKLTDVTGPVSINSIGGNIKIEFNKKLPQKLYSVYTNNGFIDITLPTSSNILIDANASEIYSNLDFKILSDEEKFGIQKMKLKLKFGKIKMKLSTDFGKIFLRKKIN